MKADWRGNDSNGQILTYIEVEKMCAYVGVQYRQPTD